MSKRVFDYIYSEEPSVQIHSFFSFQIVTKLVLQNIYCQLNWFSLLYDLALLGVFII